MKMIHEEEYERLKSWRNEGFWVGVKTALYIELIIGAFIMLIL